MASKKRPLFGRETYTVGWICALELELTAAITMLDDVHQLLPKDAKDENSYTLGRIGDHNVVLALLPRTGKANAAIAATNLQRSFPAVRFTLMVGIGGGVPYPTTHDIRLGDVVVCKPDSNSGGVVQYDYGKTIAEGKFTQTSRLASPSPELLSVAGTLRATHAISGSGNLVAHIKGINTMHLAKGYYRYPGRDRDILYTADYDGPPDHKTCDGCDKSKICMRKDRESDAPKIFYGIIASGDRVMRHGGTRDKHGEEQNVLCFEMEAAGLMDNYPCMVIRGISDYADSHKTKEWQDYAAIVAAAYGKEFLSYIAPERVANVGPAAKAISKSPLTLSTSMQVVQAYSASINVPCVNISKNSDLSLP
jgi:nucleoside phosphorylase